MYAWLPLTIEKLLCYCLRCSTTVFGDPPRKIDTDINQSIQSLSLKNQQSLKTESVKASVVYRTSSIHTMRLFQEYFSLNILVLQHILDGNTGFSSPLMLIVFIQVLSQEKTCHKSYGLFCETDLLLPKETVARNLSIQRATS